MKTHKAITAAALTLLVAAAPASFAKNNKGHGKGKHKGETQSRSSRDDRRFHDDRLNQAWSQYDTNNDGMISRSEFPADAYLFDRLDTNRDGVLTRGEAQEFATSGRARDEFRQLDANRDGMVSRNEWRGDLATFDRLDRNRDGVLSKADREEFRRNGVGRNEQLSMAWIAIATAS